MSLELTLAYVGLVVVIVTWGIDKTEWLDGKKGIKTLKQLLGVFYIIIGLFLATIYYLFVR